MQIQGLYHRRGSHPFQGGLHRPAQNPEEPPAHVVFLLATTEPGKLPATIHSRCQRFDFHRVSTPDLVARLKYIADDIGAAYDEAGLRAIALAGQGSVRDALSIADECLAFCENDLVGEKVRAVLGGVSKQAMFSFADSLLAGDAKGALGFFDRAVAEGVDLLVFVRELSGHFRDLMVAISCGADPSLIECTDEDLKNYARQAQSCPVEKALRAIDLLSATESAMKWLSRPRIAVEAALVRICRPQDEPPALDALLERVSTLEKRLAGGDYARKTAAEDDLPPFSIDEEPKKTPVQPKKAAKPPVADNAAGPAEKRKALPRLPVKAGRGAVFNALLSAMPGMLQPVLPGGITGARRQAGTADPEEMQVRPGGLRRCLKTPWKRSGASSRSWTPLW